VLSAIACADDNGYDNAVTHNFSAGEITPTETPSPTPTPTPEPEPEQEFPETTVTPALPQQQPPNPPSDTVVADGVFPDGLGLNGAEWRLYDEGTLVVDSGFIERGGVLSDDPWSELRALGEFREDVLRIMFTGPIVCGELLIGLFSGLSNVTDIFGLTYFDTSNVSYMTGLFAETHSLTNLDLSSFDTSNVITMANMFHNATALTSLDLSSFVTSNVTGMQSMFANASSLTSLELSNFDTSNVMFMADMFSHTHNLTTLDLSNFDTSSVTGASGMSQMFMHATGLTSLDISSFDTSSVPEMGWMFYDTPSLRQLTLGSNFEFNLSYNPYLQQPPHTYTVWQNGVFSFTADEFMSNYDGRTMAGTWIWN
jgi:surface protein